MNRVDCKTEPTGGFRHEIHTRKHTLHADLDEAGGSMDSAPSGHDYFDTALAACKCLTATWYAKKKGFPLERVESHVERDNSEERNGVYKLRVRLEFHGPLTDEQRAALHKAVSACPVHKLMTTTEVQIETVT